ncbi:poly(3-hydroxybutyrate) depolymerase [Epibacterium sp. SM1969]|uniref:Poly(3-hydroxybutyrate) depolymerase n=1 Tax=Tritonibacter aquimaris TaxID=2663379 RepID=A0A844AJU3_9RHOB|nr:poly(3-hydroxybutyrate) depolymerase [Tritonibacter aquimaris]MQY41119.1 poly(3-hydroxybutyrate) depolymerase [Tritonibacter aquimaris]
MRLETSTLPKFKTQGQHSISGLSSGAFMTVQMHVAHSADFIGAGVIAGGPYRCVESYMHAAHKPADAYVLNALYVAMNPLTKDTAPNGKELAEKARCTENIDDLKNLTDDKVYIFTGSKDLVVRSVSVAATRDFYAELGVPEKNIAYDDTVPAGHSIITVNDTDSPLAANKPPYINKGDFVQSHQLLQHIYGKLKPAAQRAHGRYVQFEQEPFWGEEGARASMAKYGYAYIPSEVDKGIAEAKGVHIVMHGCKQGYSYVNYVNGLADKANQPPYGTRYITTTGYVEMAEANNIILLFPQAVGADTNAAQNPEGCWDWWGYSDTESPEPDYYSKNAVQISAVHGMLSQLASL